MQKQTNLITTWLRLTTALCLAAADVAQGQEQSQRSNPAQRPGREQPRTRRSQRVVAMKEVQVASPDGQVRFTLPQNAERLTFAIALGDTTVIEPSPLVMNLDGYDLSSDVVFSNLTRYKINETYPWYGVHSTATNRCQAAKVSLVRVQRDCFGRTVAA